MRSFADRNTFMLFAGGWVAHQEIRSDNWQLKPSVLQNAGDMNEVDALGTHGQNLWSDERNQILDLPGISGTASNSRVERLIIRLPPLSAFPRLSLTDKDRLVVSDDEQLASDWASSYDDTDESISDGDPA